MEAVLPVHHKSVFSAESATVCHQFMSSSVGRDKDSVATDQYQPTCDSQEQLFCLRHDVSIDGNLHSYKERAVRTSETLIYFYQKTWCHISEGCHIHAGRSNDLNYHSTKSLLCESLIIIYVNQQQQKPFFTLMYHVHFIHFYISFNSSRPSQTARQKVVL
jgi:hypothetical protein